MSNTLVNKGSSSDDNDITLTAAAANRVNEYKNGQGLDDVEVNLRLAVKGGGCSGYIHQLALDVARENDMIFISNDCKILVDPESFEFVKGSEIDFINELNSSGFQVNNPNAASACGCGNSFVIKEEDKCH